MKNTGLVTLTALILSSAAFAEIPFTLNAQVDAQYRWASSPPLHEGFAVHDAALYLGHSAGPAEIFIDLPFGRSASDNADFAFATDKAQAFVAYKTPWALTFKAGQFDSLFGYEAADPKDRFHTDTGIVANLPPSTHTGLLTTYEITPSSSLGFLVANPHDRGGLGDENVEFGLQGNMNFGSVSVSAGGLFQKVGTESFQEFNLLVGTKLGNFTLNLEMDAVKQPETDTTQGFALYLIHQCTERLSTGVRVERVEVPAVQGVLLSGAKLTQLTVGPSYQLTEQFKIRGDVSYLDQDTRIAEYFSNVSAVYSF